MQDVSRHLRVILDRLYVAGGVIAAFFLVAVLLIILAQMITRWIGIPFPGSTNYAGYCMAAGSFFAFAHALNSGSHIRVNLLLNRLRDWRQWAELWCLGVATCLAAYLAWFACKTIYWSYLLNDISQGQDQTPLWIPQLSMAAGAILVCIALADNFFTRLLTGNDNIQAPVIGELGEKPVSGRG